MKNSTLSSPQNFLNRELSWLSFNERVLQEAMSPLTPLIERLIFLGIYSNNLEEFYRVRVAILNRLVQTPQTKIAENDVCDSSESANLLKEIQKKVSKLQIQFDTVYDEILLALGRENVFVIDETEVTESQGRYLRKYFREEVRQHLFPLMLDRFTNFSLLKDNSIYLIADLKRKSGPLSLTAPSVKHQSTTDKGKTKTAKNVKNVKNVKAMDKEIKGKNKSNIHGKDHKEDKNSKHSKDGGIPAETYALIEIPTGEISRFVVLPREVDGRQCVILLDDLIRYCQHDMFSSLGCDEFAAYTVKFTRDAEMDLDNDVSKSFIEIVSESIKKRKHGQTVRLVYESSMPEKMLNRLRKIFGIKKKDTMEKGGKYHNFKDFMKFPRSLGGKHLQFDPLPPLYAPEFADDTPMLDVVRRQDVMLHYPYQTFQHIVELLREASIDPNVRAIKMTIYRAAKDSRIINALINAARNGKKVIVYIELQARFDEEANIYWAGRMQEEGIEVLHNMPGFKVHSKLLLIRRKEDGANRYYAVIGTGNPNEVTSRIYGDEHLLTANEQIAAEVNQVFHFLEGKKFGQPKFNHLVVSPFYTRDFFMGMVDREIANARAGQLSWMIVKLNNLVDRRIVKKLYEASAAGVHVDVIVRGICVLIPGVPGLSENIRGIRIVDRFLEHSRIFVFCNNGNEEYFIGSADWMDRNFDHRIEVTTPIHDHHIQADLREMLRIQLADNIKARSLAPPAKLGKKAGKEQKAQEREATKQAESLYTVAAELGSQFPYQPIRAQYSIYEYFKRKSL